MRLIPKLIQISILRYLIINLLIFYIGCIPLFSQIPTDYYKGTENLEGFELRNALYQIIKNHNTFPYTSSQTDVWDILKVTDKDTMNPDNVILIYSSNSVESEQEYNDGTGWTREHVWAKSHGDFGTEAPAGTDVHAIKPCDIDINSARSNLDFASGGQVYPGTQCRYTSNSWEPANKVKGDVARMIFYMATRYRGENGEPALEIVDYVNSSPDKESFHGKLSDLLFWNQQDTVDEWEKQRNDHIYYQFQHNRNPFIDHPEFADKIYSKIINSVKIEKTDQILVYLSPHDKLLKIIIPDTQIKQLKTQFRIFNSIGQELINNQLNAFTSLISCSYLKSGLYIIQIRNKQKIITSKKLIIR
jgi:endonuclease I